MQYRIVIIIQMYEICKCCGLDSLKKITYYIRCLKETWHSAITPKSEDNYVEKVFNWSKVHLSEMTCYKIHTLVPIFGASGLQLALFLADKTRDSLGCFELLKHKRLIWCIFMT